MFVNGLVTFLDVCDKIDMKRFGPGRLEDEYGHPVVIEGGHTVPLLQDAHYYFYRTFQVQWFALTHCSGTRTGP